MVTAVGANEDERKIRLGVAMTGEMHRLIKIAAARNRVTVQEWAERTLRKELEREK